MLRKRVRIGFGKSKCFSVAEENKEHTFVFVSTGGIVGVAGLFISNALTKHGLEPAI